MVRAIVATILLCLFAWAALARDDGRYAQSPNKQWFDSLTNRKGGSCCSNADGLRLDDPDWQQTSESKSGYRVRLEGVWQDVPEDAVVDGNNRVGYAIVWPVGAWEDGRTVQKVRCFMPGTGV